VGIITISNTPLDDSTMFATLTVKVNSIFIETCLLVYVSTRLTMTQNFHKFAFYFSLIPYFISLKLLHSLLGFILVGSIFFYLLLLQFSFDFFLNLRWNTISYCLVNFSLQIFIQQGTPATTLHLKTILFSLFHALHIPDILSAICHDSRILSLLDSIIKK